MWNAHPSLKSNKSFMLKAVQIDSFLLMYASDGIQNDPEFILAALSNPSGGDSIMKYAGARLKADKAFMVEAIKLSPSAFRYADASIQADKEVVLAAVAQDGQALSLASRELQRDPQLIIKAGLQIAASSKFGISVLRDYVRSINLPDSIAVCIEKLYIDKDGLHTQICQKITEYRNREIGLALLIGYSKHCQDQSFASVYKTLTDNKKGTPVVHTLLPALYPAKWLSEGKLPPEQQVQIKHNIWNCLHAPDNREKFRKIHYNLTQNFLLAGRGLNNLQDRGLLTSEQALTLFGKSCQNHQAEKLEDTLAALANGSELGLQSHELYKSLFVEGILLQESLSAESINHAISKMRRAVLPAALDIPEEELQRKYEATFGSITFPNALTTYAIALRAYGGPEEDFTRFIKDVLKGDDRSNQMYDTQENLTLRKIGANTPQVLDRWKEILQPLSRDEYVFDEIDDPLARFDTMTAGPASCLSVNSGSLNKLALLSASGDGNIHILRVKDLAGKVIGRSLLRLAVDSQEKPVLILELVYSHHNKSSIDMVIEELAIQKADQLRVPLITCNRVYNQVFKEISKSFQCLGGQYQWFYSDVGSFGLREKKDAELQIRRIVSEYIPEDLNH
jgi:hypothetical protein